MNDTFEEFVKEYTRSFGDETKLIDSLKKQYEMYMAEELAVKTLVNKYNMNRVQRKQLLPNDLDYFMNNDRGALYNIDFNMFKFDMGVKNIFVSDVPSTHIYLIEGIATTTTSSYNKKVIDINDISFFIGDECRHIVAGYQINDLYYLESPVLVQGGETLKIEVNLSEPHNNFPILFIGYKFYDA